MKVSQLISTSNATDGTSKRDILKRGDLIRIYGREKFLAVVEKKFDVFCMARFIDDRRGSDGYIQGNVYPEYEIIEIVKL